MMDDVLHSTLKKAKIVPVAVFNDVRAALKTAEILIENSILLVEVTLRTPQAFDCLEAIAKKFDELLVGAGSVLTPEALKKSADKGARFGVAPCLDSSVTAAAASMRFPFIPGVSTPSELNAALGMGIDHIKIFPASNLGGPGYISAVTAPFNMYTFHLVPTGGVNENNLLEYLKNPRVIACGASYFIDSALIEKGDFETVKARVARVKEILSS